MYRKRNNYKVSKVYIQDDKGYYKEIYSLHPINQSPLGHYQVALLEIKENRLTDKGIERLIEFLEELKNTS